MVVMNLKLVGVFGLFGVLFIFLIYEGTMQYHSSCNNLNQNCTIMGNVTYFNNNYYFKCNESKTYTCVSKSYPVYHHINQKCCIERQVKISIIYIVVFSSSLAFILACILFISIILIVDKYKQTRSKENIIYF